MATLVKLERLCYTGDTTQLPLHCEAGNGAISIAEAGATIHSVFLQEVQADLLHLR